jgi:hypothetical protein
MELLDRLAANKKSRLIVVPEHGERDFSAIGQPSETEWRTHADKGVRAARRDARLL